jgi:glycerol uptake facilitator-like aquaporin
MATKKPKTSARPKTKSSKPKTTEVKKVEKAEVITSKTVEKKSCFAGFFAKKYEGTESILTIFKNPKFYGALIGEIIGSFLITTLLFALALMGLHSVATYSIAIIAVLIGVYAFSGSCLNPIITVGMMVTRRISVIRGVMYILAEIVGAWLAWVIFNAFQLAGGDTAYALPSMSAVADGKFFVTAMIEMISAIIVAFFYARAIKYKRSIFTFAAIVAGGFAFVMVVAYVISAAFLSLQSNFIVNPAAALMFQIFPTAGENFGEIFGGICQALSIYVLLPAVGGILGFYLADFTSKLSGEE